jgi:large subunit ribosomal protein L4
MAIQKDVTYNMINEDTFELDDSDKITLNLSILENSGNYVVHKDINRQQLQQKQGTVSTKTRSEVRGGGRKPWRQKGTGRARAGSNRSPLWKGGGVIFGPKAKKICLKLNKKERRLALQTVLYSRRNNISVIASIESLLKHSKTIAFIKFCNASNIRLDKRVLLIVSEKTNFLKLATQNMQNIELISASNLNTLALLKAKEIYITNAAIIKVKEIYCG